MSKEIERERTKVHESLGFHWRLLMRLCRYANEEAGSQKKSKVTDWGMKVDLLKRWGNYTRYLSKDGGMGGMLVLGLFIFLVLGYIF